MYLVIHCTSEKITNQEFKPIEVSIEHKHYSHYYESQVKEEVRDFIKR